MNESSVRDGTAAVWLGLVQMYTILSCNFFLDALIRPTIISSGVCCVVTLKIPCVLMLCFQEEKATPPHLHTITKTQQHTRLLLFDRFKLFLRAVSCRNVSTWEIRLSDMTPVFLHLKKTSTSSICKI